MKCAVNHMKSRNEIPKATFITSIKPNRNEITIISSNLVGYVPNIEGDDDNF